MDFQRIDLARWERREHYLHYMNAVVCSYSLTTELNVTPLSGRRLYPALLWLLTATVNELPAFRTSLMDGEPVLFSDMHPSYTVFHRQTETFSVLWTEFDRDYKVFEKAYEADAARCLGRPLLRSICRWRERGDICCPSLRWDARRKRTASVRFRWRFRCTTLSATGTMSADF